MARSKHVPLVARYQHAQTTEKGMHARGLVKLNELESQTKRNTLSVPVESGEAPQRT